MVETSGRKSNSGRGKSSSPEYGYIGGSTQTGREGRVLKHGGVSPESSPQKKGQVIPATPSSTHTDRV